MMGLLYPKIVGMSYDFVLVLLTMLFFFVCIPRPRGARTSGCTFSFTHNHPSFIIVMWQKNKPRFTKSSSTTESLESAYWTLPV